MPNPNFDGVKFWKDRWKRKPDASGAKPITYNAIQDRLVELMEEGLLKAKGKRILDLGCGRGEILEWLVGVHGAEGVGVDTGAQPVQYLNGRKLVKAIQDDIRGFRDAEKFDVILSCFVLQHMVHQTDILAFHETVLGNLASRGMVILIENFTEGEAVNARFHSLEFYDQLWEDLGLRRVSTQDLMKNGIEVNKKVVCLKRGRPGWKKVGASSGLTVGKQSENPISPEICPYTPEISVPLNLSSESTLSPLPDGHLLEGMEEKELPEDVSWMLAQERPSGQPSTDDLELMI